MKKGMGLKRLLSWTLCICMCLSTCVFGAQQVRATDGAADSVQDAADAPQEPTIVHDHTDWAAWRGETVDGNIASGNYYLAEDLTLSQTAYAVLGEVTLCLNGHTLYVGSSQISINSGATLTLTDCGAGVITGGTNTPVLVKGGAFLMQGGTISGNQASSTSKTYSGGVYMASGTFTMEGGSISNNTATIGGGVYVESGEFLMKGGTISENTSTGNGGGVWIGSGSTFTMENGAIADNHASSQGGGVHMNGLTGDSVFLMKGGTISGNDAQFAGGGVYMMNKSSFTMENGVISANSVVNTGGGGVYMTWGSSFTMKGGEISDNEAMYKGGGVYVERNGFTMENGKISGNRAADGGGVYVRRSVADFTMENGEISGNSATGTGGGVYVDEGVFNVNGGTVSDNTAQAQGGGVYVGSGSFIMENGVLSRNTGSSGGGVYMGSGVFTMKGGELSDNSVTSPYGFGGGVYVAGGGAADKNGGSFTMESGTISGNDANYGGGVAVGNGTFTMKNGGISDNRATYGGGVHVMSTFTMEGGTISGNTAQSYGGGIAVYSGTFGVSGAPVITGNTLTDDGTESNVCLVKETEYIHVTGELTDGAKLGVNRLTDVKQTPVLTAGYGDFHTDDAGKYFFYDNAESNGNCGVGTGSDGEAWFGYHVTFKDKNAQTLGEQFVGYNGTASPWPLGSGDGTWATDIGGAPFDFSTPVTANLTLYTDRELAHADGPVVEKSKAQVKMTRTSATAVAERFQFRVISKISDADWNAYFANTGSSDPQAAQKNAITELGFVVYKGIQGFDMETARAAAKAGHDQGDYTVATTNYIRHIDGSDAEFAVRIEITSLASNSDVTYIAFVKYLDADGKEAYAFYETAGTALLSANYDSIVSAYLAAFPFGE